MWHAEVTWWLVTEQNMSLAGASCSTWATKCPTTEQELPLGLALRHGGWASACGTASCVGTRWWPWCWAPAPILGAQGELPAPDHRGHLGNGPADGGPISPSVCGSASQVNEQILNNQTHTWTTFHPLTWRFHGFLAAGYTQRPRGYETPSCPARCRSRPLPTPFSAALPQLPCDPWAAAPSALNSSSLCRRRGSTSAWAASPACLSLWVFLLQADTFSTSCTGHWIPHHWPGRWGLCSQGKWPKSTWDTWFLFTFLILKMTRCVLYIYL